MQQLGWQARRIRCAARTLPVKPQWIACQGACHRAHRIRDAGGGGVRRRIGGLCIPRAHFRKAWRDDTDRARSGTGASVRRGDRTTRWLDTLARPAEYGGGMDPLYPVARVLGGRRVTGNGGNHRMTISRRDSLALGAAALGAASIPIVGARAAFDDVPTADVKPPEYKIEKGASLHMIRPAKFVDPDEVYWKKNTEEFTKK